MSVRQGTYQWDIDDPTLMNKIINAANNEQFESDIFRIGQINWRINICPNGWTKDQIGSFHVFLQLITLPSSWKSIIINRTIQSPQTKSSDTGIDTYNKSGQSKGWPTNTLRFQEIKESKFNKLIFVVQIKILRIILKENDKIFYHYKFNWIKHQKIIWNLDEKIFRNAKKIYNGKQFESKIFNNMWSIALYPNGHKTKYNGKCIVALSLCAFPLTVSAVDIQWNLSIPQINFKRTQTEKITIGKGGKWISVGSFNDFLNVKEMEIMIDALILKEYDSNNKEIEIKSMQNEDEKYDFMDNNKYLQGVNEKLDLLQQKNDAMSYQLKLYDAKINSLSSNFNQKMQEMRSMNETQIKSLNDRISTIFEEEQKENVSEINKLKQEINKIKLNANQNKNANNNENMNKLRLFFEYELNLPQYFDAIIDAGFKDILSLNVLTNEDLKEMDVKIAHRRPILKAIQQKQPKQQPPQQPEGGTDWH